MNLSCFHVSSEKTNIRNTKNSTLISYRDFSNYCVWKVSFTLLRKSMHFLILTMIYKKKVTRLNRDFGGRGQGDALGKAL